MKVIAVAVLAVLGFLPVPASAALLYTLNVDGCGSPCGAGPYGTVLLVQGAADTVHVKVTLFSPYEFVNTGAGDALAFSITGNPAISIANLTTNFAQDLSTPPIHASTFGYFDYGVLWTLGSGGSQPTPGPLEFDVTDLTDHVLTPSDFIPSLDAKKNGNPTLFNFASDIGAAGPGGNGKTGNVAANGAPCNPDADQCGSICLTDPDACTIQDAPEPATLALFGGGLLGFGAMRRRRKR